MIMSSIWYKRISLLIHLVWNRFLYKPKLIRNLEFSRLFQCLIINVLAPWSLYMLSNRYSFVNFIFLPVFKSVFITYYQTCHTRDSRVLHFLKSFDIISNIIHYVNHFFNYKSSYLCPLSKHFDILSCTNP